MKRSTTESKTLRTGERLRGRKDLKRVFNSRLRFGCPGLKILLSENSFERNRIAFTASRGFKGSVERNRAKRRTREIFRSRRAALKQGYDIICIVYPGRFTYSEREEQFDSLFERAALIQ